MPPNDLRIAYMTGEYPRATDTFIQREVAALRERGVHVSTFSIRRPPSKETVGPEQAAERERTRYLLPACPLDLVKSHGSLLWRSPGRYFRALSVALRTRPAGLKPLVWQLAYFAEAGLLARHMSRDRLEHLHNHFSNSSCSVAMLASILGDFSYSFTMHGPAEFFEPKYWRIDEKVRRAKFVCCISQFCRSQAMIFAPQDAWGRMHIVHCGIDPAKFTPRTHEGRGRRVLFVGRLAAVKGMPVMLEAIARLAGDFPEIELMVAGDGPDRARLEEQARRLGIERNVSFLGYQSQGQVRELLAGSDVFAMASFAEGVPVVLMEAMAAGVPVVATRIAGIPELVDDEKNGLLVPASDIEALSAAIGRLLGDAALRTRLAGAARAKVESEFNLGVEAERLCNLMTRLLRGEVARSIERAEVSTSDRRAEARPAGVPV